MFTGIVEEVGVVRSLVPEGEGIRMRIEASTAREGLVLGDSVAVDGVCLTAVELGEGSFDVQAIGTTLGRTILGGYREGRRVNLERALAFGARLGGHLVQGHVDGVGRVVRMERRSEKVLIDFTLPPGVSEVTVLHGSLTLNGVSLTVNALPEPGVAQVSIIPFTWDHTALSDLEPGDGVNLEGDMIGKYVRHLLGAPARPEGGADGTAGDLLRAWGYGGTP